MNKSIYPNHYIGPGLPSMFTLDKSKAQLIKKTVSTFFQIGQDRIDSKTRKKEVVDARFASMYFIKKYTQLSLENIAKNHNRKNHTTVINAITEIENKMEIYKKDREQLEKLENIISNYLYN